MALDSRPITLVPVTDFSLIDSLSEQLINECSELDVEISRDTAVLCVKHLLYVLQVNKYINLTNITDVKEAVSLHLTDSLSLLRIFPCEPGKLLDFGTGAGFPGLPLAIHFGCDSVLIDSVGKKVKAVNSFIHQLQLKRCSAVHERVEVYACSHREEFDAVVARAVGISSLLIEYATPLLHYGGYFVLAKANPSHDEMTDSNRVSRMCGLDLICSDEFDLPNGAGHRTLSLYQKVSAPKVQLPRSVGEAKRNPL